MTIEHLWRHDEIANEWKKSAHDQLAMAAPPQETQSGTYAFGKHAPVGSVSHIAANEQATGYFVSVNRKTGQPVVYTHVRMAPKRAGGVDLGEHDMADLVPLCVPAHPVNLAIGTNGPANREITQAEFALISDVCAKRKWPGPLVAGRPAPTGSWPTAVLV